MAGQLGDVLCSVQNLELIKIDLERNLLLIKGAVPGSKESYLIIKKAVKRQKGS